jgi:hypothetical protein
LRYAVALAHDYGARLIILHVVKTLTPETAPPHETDPGGARSGSRVPIEYVLRQGDTVATILRTARERDCDLMVLGCQGRRGWRRFFGPGRAERILRGASCPVLVVKDSMTPIAFPRDAAPASAAQPPSPPNAPPNAALPRAETVSPEPKGWSVSA